MDKLFLVAFEMSLISSLPVDQVGNSYRCEWQHLVSGWRCWCLTEAEPGAEKKPSVPFFALFLMEMSSPDQTDHTAASMLPHLQDSSSFLFFVTTKLQL